MKKLFTKLALAGAMLGLGLGLGLSTAQADPLKVGFVYLTNPGDHGWTLRYVSRTTRLERHWRSRPPTNI